MSRIEENQRVCDLWFDINFTGSKDQIEMKILSVQTNFLADISKSLAVLADVSVGKIIVDEEEYKKFYKQINNFFSQEEN